MKLKYMNKKIILLLAAFVLMLSGCENNNPFDGGAIISPPPPISYYSPVWHPGGQIIGFNHTPIRYVASSNQFEWAADSAGFWLINADGTNMHRIFPYTLQDPAWSPDGQWIAFVENGQIYKMKFNGTSFDTTSIAQLTTEGNNFFPAWSSDNQWIAYDSDTESPNGMHFIWKMKVDGSAKERIAYDPSEGEIRMPNWSPDSRYIVHIRPVVGTSAPEIFIMDSKGNYPMRLTNNSSFDDYPRYSPDGAKIAYASQTNVGQPQIWLMNSDGSNQTQLTAEGISAIDVPFTWSPTGDIIVYTKYRFDQFPDQNGTLWLLNVSTGQDQQLTFNPVSPN